MARHLFFAMALIGFGGLLNSPAEAVSPLRCEDRAANCVGSCTNHTGGVYQHNRCMSSCDRRVIACLVRANASVRWR